MKTSHKTFLLLPCLVLVVYLMRQNDLSFSQALTLPIRTLQATTTSVDWCLEIDLNEEFSSSEISQAQTFQDTLNNMRGGNPFKNFVYTGSRDPDNVSEFGKTLIGFVAAWVILFLISILCCLGFYFNWCCMYGVCKNVECCTMCKKPRSQAKKKLFIFFSAFLLLGMLGSAVAGVVISSGTLKNMKRTFCSVANLIDTLSYGSTSEQWVGLKPAIGGLQVFVDSIDSAATGLPTKAELETSYGDVQTELNTTSASIQAMYDSNKAKTATRASDSTTYSPTYISNLGPTTDPVKNTGQIMAEINKQSQVVLMTRDNATSAVYYIKSQANDIKQSLNSAMNTAASIQSSIGDTSNKFRDHSSGIDGALTGFSWVITGVFIVNIVLALIAIASIILIGACRIRVFNKLLHLSWAIIAIFTIIGWAICVFLYPTSIIMMEACDVLQSSIKDKSLFTGVLKLAELNNPDVVGILDVCLYEDGNALQYFGLTDKLSSFTKLITSLGTVQSTFDLSSTAAPTSVTIPKHKNTITQTKTGLISDADSTTEDLKTLNSKINKDSNTACAKYADTWTLNLDSCAQGITVFQSSSADTFNTPNPTCIGFNAWGTTHNFDNRYSPNGFTLPTCSQDFSTAKTLVNNFANTNRPQVTQVFTDLETSITTVETNYGTLSTSMNNALNNFRRISSALGNIITVLVGSDTQTGLAGNSKCTFVKTGLTRTADAACYGTAVKLYQSSILFIIMSVMTLFGSFSVFCLAKRFIVQDKSETYAKRDGYY